MGVVADEMQLLKEFSSNITAEGESTIPRKLSEEEKNRERKLSDSKASK